jgi:hypothetical protein
MDLFAILIYLGTNPTTNYTFEIENGCLPVNYHDI